MTSLIAVVLILFLQGSIRPYGEHMETRPYGENGYLHESDGITLAYTAPANDTIMWGTAVLGWTSTHSGPGDLVFDVYFGTDTALVSEEQAEFSYSAAINYDSTYYWKVIAKNDSLMKTGDLRVINGVVSDPRLIPNLVDYYRADTLVFGQNAAANADTVVRQAGPVRRWQSTESTKSWFQAQLAPSPTYDTTTVFGVGIKFTTDDALVLAKSGYTGANNQIAYPDSNLTMMVVWQSGVIPAGTYINLVWVTNIAQSITRWGMLIRDRTKALLNIAPTGYVALTNKYADSTRYWDALSMTSLDSARWYHNGVHSYSYGKLKNTAIATDITTLMGVYPNTGTIREIIVMDTCMTPYHTQLMTAYIRRKYGF